MAILHIDFETRSAVDLKKAGVHVYAADPSTEILCMAYAFDDEPVQLWKRRTAFPTRVLEHIYQGHPVYAHNAAFERALWNARNGSGDHYLPEDQMHCTMAMAYAMGLPGHLADAAAALGLEQRKDAKGQRVMMQLCKPRAVADDGTVTWWDDPAKYEILYAYCKQDVEVERALHHRLMELSDSEQRLWRLDQRINDRGVLIDRPAIERALELVESERKRLDAAMRKTTGNAVATCTAVGQFTDWLRAMGVETGGVAKADISALLSTELPPVVREALLLRQEAAKSSTAKLKAMLDRAGADNRMRGLFQYHGAATGRWAARGPQLQNLPRPSIVKKEPEVEDVFAHLDRRDWLDMAYGSPLQVISDCLRGFIVAPKNSRLVVGDYSNIEGRVLAWLAGEDWKLQAFRDFDAGTGPDLYLVAASRIHRCTVEEARPHRQEGKTAELACGYGGGIGAFQAMAKTFGLTISDEQADAIKVKWREAHPATVKFWRDLERAAIAAVKRGEIQSVGLGRHGQPAGLIAFKKAGSFLWCKLPSGRVLCYPYPEVNAKELPWHTPEKPAIGESLSYMTVNSVTRKWERQDTYGGSLAENVTQAVARDLLADAMVKCEAAGMPVVMHVHDEIVVEATSRVHTLAKLTSIMQDTPAWAAGLPTAVAGYEAQRYRKD